MQVHRRISRLIRAGLPLLPFALSACYSTAEIGETTHAIEMFHFDLDQAYYAQIWKSTASEMRTSTTEPDLTKFLTAVHKKLGQVAQTQQMGVNVNYNTAGTYITVTMHTRFQHGTGDETFVFRSKDNDVRLVGYHVASNDMMML